LNEAKRSFPDILCMGSLSVLLKAIVKILLKLDILNFRRALKRRRAEVVLVDGNVLVLTEAREISLVKVNLGLEVEVVVVGLEHLDGMFYYY
jgi:hypothetical protein